MEFLGLLGFFGEKCSCDTSGAAKMSKIGQISHNNGLLIDLDHPLPGTDLKGARGAIAPPPPYWFY